MDWTTKAGICLTVVLFALIMAGRHYGVIWDGADCEGWIGPCASAR